METPTPTSTGTSPAVGTTIDVLQAYPLGTLEVEWQDWQGNKHRGIVVRLSAQHARVKGYPFGCLPIASLKPVLKPFRALTTPLADGTLAAGIELVKAISFYCLESEDAEAPQPKWETATITSDESGFRVTWDEVEPNDGEEYWGVFKIDSDWSGYWETEDGNVPAGPIMTDYLRRNHFATPVNGRPLIEGVDFIAKP